MTRPLPLRVSRAAWDNAGYVVGVEFGEPEGAVGAVDDRSGGTCGGRNRVACGRSEDAGRGHAPDRVAHAVGEPNRTVGADRQSERAAAARYRVLRYRGCTRRQLVDCIQTRVGE